MACKLDMKLGVHISTHQGIQDVPRKAKELGCECFQIFSHSPYGGKIIEIDENLANDFKRECKKYKFQDYYIHSPYYINFASANNRVYYGSISAIKKELIVANLIGAKAVITHLGSARDLGEKKALEQTANALNSILEHHKSKASLFIEISAGAGKIIGDSFSEIGEIIKNVGNKKFIGVCFDTAHSFESGYDLRTTESVRGVFKEFDEGIGLGYLKLIHCNDSKTDLGSHIDRHENIGEGKIGFDGIKAVIDFARKRDLNLILETPGGEEADKRSLEILKKMREK